MIFLLINLNHEIIRVLNSLFIFLIIKVLLTLYTHFKQLILIIFYLNYSDNLSQLSLKVVINRTFFFNLFKTI